MTHEAVLHMLAIVMLTCVGFVITVDFASESGFNPALRMKWSMLWYAARYISIVCGLLLALDVLF